MCINTETGANKRIIDALQIGKLAGFAPELPWKNLPGNIHNSFKIRIN